MLTVPGRERETLFDGSRGDQRVERLQSRRLGIRLHQVLCAARDIPGRRNLLVGGNHDFEIVHLTLAAGTADQFKRRDRREQAGTAETVQVVGGFGISAYSNRTVSLEKERSSAAGPPF